jgi:hypothetical protein
MQNTLLWSLLSNLSPVELNEAARWLASPIHNRREDIRLLLSALAEAVRNQAIAPDRHELWRRLFPQEPYNDQEFRLRCAYLLRQLEDWLAWRRWRSEPLREAGHTLAAYRERKLDLHFHKRLTAARLARDKTSLRPASFYLAAYHIEAEAYEYQLAQGQRLRLQNLETQDEALTNAFLSLKLRQACLALAHKQVSGADYRLALVAEALEWAARPPYADAPAVALYREACLSLLNPDDEPAFERFRQAVISHFQRLPATEMRDLLLLALNACIRRINQGKSDALRDALALYQLGLSSELLLENGRLTSFTYNNIAVVAIGLGEAEWADGFIQQYKQHLDPEQREQHFALNAARLAHHRRDYGQALHHLQRADYRDFFHQMMARMLQLKIYVATREADLLDALIKNTRAFLRRQRPSSYHGQNYRNILRLTEKITRLMPGDRAAADQLRRLIEQTDPLTEREWLLSVLDVHLKK